MHVSVKMVSVVTGCILNYCLHVSYYIYSYNCSYMFILHVPLTQKKICTAAKYITINSTTEVAKCFEVTLQRYTILNFNSIYTYMVLLHIS